MEYKLSNFNYYVPDGDGLRLYNSLSGKYSLIYILPKNVKFVEAIKNDVNNAMWIGNPIFETLKDCGFIISEQTNEDMLVDLKYNDVVNSSTLFLIILPTEKCNFNCKYCYEDHKKGRMSDDIQSGIVKFVQKNIKYYSNLCVSWFGGEPLEELDIIENMSKKFIDICKIARKSYSASITTNGYNLSKDVFEKLLSLSVYNYQITIDGTEAIHNKFRVLLDGNGTHKQIIKNLKDISQIKRNTFMITIRTNFSKESFCHMEDYLELLDELFGDDERFSLSVHQIGNWGGNTVDSVQDSIMEFDSYKEILQRILQLKPKISMDAHLIDLDLSSSLCYATSRNQFVIASDGEIHKCTEDFESDFNHLGFIDKNGDMELDEEKLAKWMGFHKSIKCKIKCKYYGSCAGYVCPKIALNNASRTSCPNTVAAIPEILLLINKNNYKEI